MKKACKAGRYCSLYLQAVWALCGKVKRHCRDSWCWQRWMWSCGVIMNVTGYRSEMNLVWSSGKNRSVTGRPLLIITLKWCVGSVLVNHSTPVSVGRLREVSTSRPIITTAIILFGLSESVVQLNIQKHSYLPQQAVLYKIFCFCLVFLFYYTLIIKTHRGRLAQ